MYIVVQDIHLCKVGTMMMMTMTKTEWLTKSEADENKLKFLKFIFAVSKSSKISSNFRDKCCYIVICLRLSNKPLFYCCCAVAAVMLLLLWCCCCCGFKILFNTWPWVNEKLKLVVSNAFLLCSALSRFNCCGKFANTHVPLRIRASTAAWTLSVSPKYKIDNKRFWISFLFRARTCVFRFCNRCCRLRTNCVRMGGIASVFVRPERREEQQNASEPVTATVKMRSWATKRNGISFGFKS